MSLNCICCDRQLEDVMPDIYNQPHAGTAFYSRGHYGSTIWDPMSSRIWLEINVCDECMQKRADDGVILIVQEPYVRPEYNARPWLGKDDHPEYPERGGEST